MADLDDVARIPYILEHYDNVERSIEQNGKVSKSKEFKNADGNPSDVILFSK